MKERVIVAMSGGVDSSVAAYLLKESGYEVIGITMCFGFTLLDSEHLTGFTKNIEVKKRPLSCGWEGIEDAKRIAQKIGIRHYILNFSNIFEEKVIKNFIQEYLKGRTPNPCIRCNQFIKFGSLLERIKEFDAQYLATGHYARIIKDQPTEAKASVGCPQKGSEGGQKFLLKRAKDRTKDQSYFLYRLGQEKLKYTIFPLGNYTKEEVRDVAIKIDLPVAEKLASQEICFIPDGDYRRFLKNRLTQIKTQMSTDIREGPIVDKKGNLLGFHKGIPFYTIGQREGLNINNKPGPFYVISINPKKNEILVGSKEDTKAYGLVAKELNFISIDFPKKQVVLKARIRYNHRESDAEIYPLSNRKVKVIFKEPQFAVCRGQSVVFYDKDTVIGGGIIEKSLT